MADKNSKIIFPGIKYHENIIQNDIIDEIISNYLQEYKKYKY